MRVPLDPNEQPRHAGSLIDDGNIAADFEWKSLAVTRLSFDDSLWVNELSLGVATSLCPFGCDMTGFAFDVSHEASDIIPDFSANLACVVPEWDDLSVDGALDVNLATYFDGSYNYEPLAIAGSLTTAGAVDALLTAELSHEAFSFDFSFHADASAAMLSLSSSHFIPSPVEASATYTEGGFAAHDAEHQADMNASVAVRIHDVGAHHTRFIEGRERRL